MTVCSMHTSRVIGATKIVVPAMIGLNIYQHTIVSLKRNGRYMYSKLTGPRCRSQFNKLPYPRQRNSHFPSRSSGQSGDLLCDLRP
jgi:hypothetical protein